MATGPANPQPAYTTEVKCQPLRGIALYLYRERGHREAEQAGVLAAPSPASVSGWRSQPGGHHPHLWQIVQRHLRALLRESAEPPPELFQAKVPAALENICKWPAGQGGARQLRPQQPMASSRPRHRDRLSPRGHVGGTHRTHQRLAFRGLASISTSCSIELLPTSQIEVLDLGSKSQPNRHQMKQTLINQSMED